jgi:methylglutaconyl-CoA hydratase
MAYNTLNLEIVADLATITLDRPEKRNAISTEMIEELVIALGHAESSAARVVVNGPAIAGGCGIATVCDFTLAAPEAKFGYTEVRIGFIPAIVSVFLRRQIGEKSARDLLLTGRIIDAGEALRLGLTTKVVLADDLMAAAKDLAATLISCSPTSLFKTKRLLTEFEGAEIDRELELAVAENAQIRSTPDFREGLSSFLEKRAPRWSGS